MLKGHQYDLLDSVIGQGGQGVILTAFDKTTKQTVAVKTFSVDHKGAFEREEMVAYYFQKRLPKHICEIYDVCLLESGKSLVFMKKYKTDLFDFAFHSPNGKLSEVMCKKLFRQICKGVAELHEIGIAHMDIKPENVLLSDGGNAYLCDFGCSLLVDTTGKDIAGGDRCEIAFEKAGGTAEYRAPDITRKNIVFDPFKADVYSLGVLLFAIMTGSFPFDEPGKPVIIEIIKDEVPPQCFDLLTKLLTKNPNERYPIQQVLSHPWVKKKRLSNHISHLKQPVVKFINSIVQYK